MDLSTKLSQLKGVGPKMVTKLAGLGLVTTGDLINYYPRRYDDYSVLSPVAKLKPGQGSIKARITQAGGRYVRGRLHITEAIASDESGSLRLVWFNQPYRAASIKSGQTYYISGRYELRRGRFSMTNPSVELASDLPLQTARILAVYKVRGDVTSRYLRSLVGQITPVIEELVETLPAWLVKEAGLVGRSQALKQLHLPDSGEALEAARRRLGFEEVFQLVLASLLNKIENKSEPAIKVHFKEDLAKQFVGHLPFKLTADQRRAVWQVYKDMERAQPMNRLIEGDVGSGKTVVAAMAALMAMDNNYQVALMAPTELLARQHGETLFSLLRPLQRHSDLLLLIGSQSRADKQRAVRSIKSGRAKLIVGTQTLIQEKIDMDKLALIIIDEQHRFGVDQRKRLMAKAGHMPHVLSLSATPIPRSLALTLYGELDISVLAEKPPGRRPIKTKVVPPAARQRLYDELKPILSEGRQMYVVCPLITESANGQWSAEAVYQTFTEGTFKDYRVGLLHGRLKADDKAGVMADFINRKLDILVATTVIEVGVDVSNASVMLIFDPERFGLAQLHQLRGRVGRGEHSSYCYLLLSEDKPAPERIRAFETLNDGFKLAELDLSLRGPGAIYGTLQHGPLDLRIAKLSDTRLIASARSSAQQFIDRQENLLKYKELAAAVKRLRAVTSLN